MLMDIYFVVLHNLVQMKSVITQMFYRMNILLLCINFDFIQFVYSMVPFKDLLSSARIC